MGRVTDSIKSEDGEVRKAKVVIFKEGNKKTVFRPISELIVLVIQELLILGRGVLSLCNYFILYIFKKLESRTARVFLLSNKRT
jgi:hypothetical protein